MRNLLRFFVLCFFLQQQVFSQASGEQSTYRDFGEVFYHGVCDRDSEWVALLLADSVIAGEAFTEGMFCSKQLLAGWLCRQPWLLPIVTTTTVKSGDAGEEDILFFSDQDMVLLISVCKEKRVVTRLGIGQKLLAQIN